MNLFGLDISRATSAPDSGLTTMNLTPPLAASTNTDPPGGIPSGSVKMSDIAGMEQFLMGYQTASGQTVTPEKARRCATVLACMRGISEDLCSLPLPLYKRSNDGDGVVYDHPVHRVLNVAPNPIMTPLEVREHMIFDMMTRGSFYNLKYDEPNSPGTLGELWPLAAEHVTRNTPYPHGLSWHYFDPLTTISGVFTADVVWRGTIMSTNGLDGTAITLLCREAIGLMMAAEEQGARLFSHGIQTDFTLQTDSDLDGPTKDDLRASLMARHAGSGNAFIPLILSGGLKASKLGLTAQESQYIEAKNWQIGDIARAFRYPEILLGASSGGKSSTYASAEQFFMAYVKHTLLPWAVRIEQTVHRDLLSTKEAAKYYVRHDFDQLLRGDQNARFTGWNLAIAGGWMQPAEARRKEGLPFAEGLDYFNRAKNQDMLGGAQPAQPGTQQ